MNALVNATMEARKRTGRNIGTTVKKGLWQAQIIDFPINGRGKSVITPLSGWVLGDLVISILNSLDAQSIEAFAAAAK